MKTLCLALVISLGAALCEAAPRTGREGAGGQKPATARAYKIEPLNLSLAPLSPADVQKFIDRRFLGRIESSPAAAAAALNALARTQPALADAVVNLSPSAASIRAEGPASTALAAASGAIAQRAKRDPAFAAHLERVRAALRSGDIASLFEGNAPLRKPRGSVYEWENRFRQVADMGIPAHLQGEFQLFDARGRPAAYYDELVDSMIWQLRHGTRRKVRARFSNREFVLTRFLGHGYLTAIFEIEDGRAIRIPLGRLPIFRSSLREQVQSYGRLKNSDLPLPRIYAAESKPDEYVVVERKRGERFSYWDFLYRRKELLAAGKLRADEIPAIEGSFVEAARSTWQLKDIADSKLNNWVLFSDGWTLVDYGRGSPASSIDDTAIFERDYYQEDYSPSFMARLKSAVRSERIRRLSREAHRPFAGELDDSEGGSPVPLDRKLYGRSDIPIIEQYYRNALESARYFQEWYEAASRITGKALMAACEAMHRIAAVGSDPSKPKPYEFRYYQTGKIVYGRVREDGRSYNTRSAALAYSNSIARLFGLGALVSGALPIPGIPREWLPINEGAKHTYPPGTRERLLPYFSRAARALAAAKSAPRGSARAVAAIADYYYALVNARAFEAINASLAMNQVNVMLRAHGFFGVSHDYLDHLAHRFTREQSRKVFFLHLNRQLPPPSKPIARSGAMVYAA